jgi:Zn-dependent protease
MSEFSLVQKIIIWAVPVVFAITVHEVAHGWVASRLGDQTARLLGRLTLNPIRHIDPIGTVLLPALMLAVSPFVFGWAKPVPVDWRNLRHPRRDMALVAAAGPGANLVMMVLWAAFTWLVLVSGDMLGNAAVPLYFMGQAGIMVNIVLMVLNLIPLPPLDGSRVVSSLLPPLWSYRYNLLERWGLLILIILLFTGILGKILWPPVQAIHGFVTQFLR